MKSFESEQSKTVQPKETIVHEAIAFESIAIKSLQCIRSELSTIKKYAEKINSASTETFISSFLSNIETIRSYHKNVVCFSNLISKLKEAPVNQENERGQEDIVSEDLSMETVKGVDKDINTSDADVRQKIKTELLEATDQIAELADQTEIAIKMIRNDNIGSSVDETVGSIKYFDTAIAKLDDIEKNINEHAKK